MTAIPDGELSEEAIRMGALSNDVIDQLRLAAKAANNTAWGSRASVRFRDEALPHRMLAIIDELLALRQHSSGAKPVVVKELEWVKHPTAEAWRCDTIVGRYQVFAMTVGHASWTMDGLPAQGDGGYENTADEAKAAAQADYEARILSALAHPVAVPSEEELEALRDLNVTDEELLRIRNSCEGIDGDVKIWAGMLQKIVDHVRDLRSRAALSEQPAKEIADG